MRPFRELQIWQRANQFGIDIYKVTSSFPAEERYGLTSQIRRAAVSISNNIAEGSKRPGQQDFIRFLTYAEGSTAEVDNMLGFARDVGFLSGEEAVTLIKEVGDLGAMLRSFRIKVQEQSW